MDDGILQCNGVLYIDDEGRARVRFTDGEHAGRSFCFHAPRGWNRGDFVRVEYYPGDQYAKILGARVHESRCSGEED